MRTFALILLAATTAAAHAQFEMQESHTTASLRGIHAVSAEVAWASGTSGTVLHTEDGGKSWKSCAVPEGAAKLDFRGVQAFDAKTAVVMSSGTGELSRLYRTRDGCKTWDLLSTNPDKEGFWDALVAADPLHLWLLGDPVEGAFPFRFSADGGKTWVVDRSRPVEKGEAVFAASNSSLLVNWPVSRNDVHFILFGTGGTPGPHMYSLDYSKSVNCGEHCEKAALAPRPIPGFPAGESAGVFGLASDGGRVVVAVGGDYKKPDEGTNTAAYIPDLYRGSGFLAAVKTPHGYRSAVAYDRASATWIAVGPNGTDISKDGGKDWQPLRPGRKEKPDADVNWNALSLPFVVGPKGRIGRLRPDALK